VKAARNEMSADPFTALITRVDAGADPPAGAATGAAAAQAPGPSRPLAGRTLLVKDLIDTAGIRTTYGSRLYADHVPIRNATVVQRALDAGAVRARATRRPGLQGWSTWG